MRILIILMDQGGGVMAWNTEEIVGTLRAQMDGHPPVVVTDGSDRDDSRPSDP